MATSETDFKPPPVVECISREDCFGIGKKIYSEEKICSGCLRRHEPQQLRLLANGNDRALALVDDEVSRKQRIKTNLELHGRYFCAFEDPDFERCRWRQQDINLRGTRTNCSVVKRKGLACSKCWNHHLEKIGIMQYFTVTGMCHEEADRRAHDTEALPAEDDNNEQEENDDDVEGYNVTFD